MLQTLPVIPRLDKALEKDLPLRPVTAAERVSLLKDLSTLREASHGIALSLDEWAESYPHGVLTRPLTASELQLCEIHLSAPARNAIERWEAYRSQIDLRELREPMVDLRPTLASLGVTFSDRPFEAACGDYAGTPRIFWVRTSVADRLRRLAKLLSHLKISFRVEDGFRPLAVQAGLYRRRLGLVKAEHPDWDPERIKGEAATKTAPTPFRAGHMGGAAADITLLDSQGQELPRGNSYPQGGVRVNLWFPYLTWEEFRTRRIFAFSATLSGLTPYPGEDWHVSRGDPLGNIYWNEKSASFGPLRSFDEKGNVEPMDADEIIKEFPG